MKELYFVRHGETDRNLNGFINPGDVDSELNKTGIKQAEIAGNNMKKDNINFDLIISSPLKRAFVTARIIAEEIGYKQEIIFDENLKEKFAGIFKDYYKKDFQKEFGVKYVENILQKYPNKKFKGVERQINFEKRIKNFFDEIKNNKNFENKKVLVVAHGGVARVILGIQNVGNCELVKMK